jgi:hypothetical protein
MDEKSPRTSRGTFALIPVSQRWRKRIGALKKPLLLYRSLRLVRCEFQIAGEGQNPPLSCVYIGEGVSLSYFLELYGCQGASQVRSVYLHNLSKEIAEVRQQFPVVLVEVNQWLKSMLPSGVLIADPWICHRTDLQGEHYAHRRRGIERGFGQRVRRYKLEARFTREAKDVETFYHEYHLPHVRTRHGGQAIARTMAQMKKAMHDGFLLQIWKGDEWVSGVIATRTESDCLTPLAVGLHPDQLEGWQNGVLAAGYYFMFRWAVENNVRWIDFGGSRPHLLTGVYRHKTLWAALPERDPWHHTHVGFYLNSSVPLPEVITQQLVWLNGKLVSISEALSAAHPVPDTETTGLTPAAHFN